MKKLLLLIVTFLVCNASLANGLIYGKSGGYYALFEFKLSDRKMTTYKNQEYKLKWMDIKHSKKHVTKEKATIYSLSSVSFNEIRYLYSN